MSQLTKKNHLKLLIGICLLLSFINKRENFEPNEPNESNNCIVIPIYPPHYKYVKHIIDNITNMDIYFVFTTNEDYNKFPYESTNNIILDEHLTSKQLSLLTSKKSLPSFKKLFALNLLYRNYDYILCIDAETKILKNPDLHKVYETNVVIGGISNNPSIRDIIKGTLKMFKNIPENNLSKISVDYTYYTWWSSMPVYKTKNILDFMKKIGFNDMNQFINEIEYTFFENMAYNYYCIIYQNFKKIVVPNIQHSLESQPTEVVEKYIDYNLGWISQNTYNQNKKFYDNKVYMVYHLDR